MNALNKQVGGNHYKGMEYQTAKFGFDVGLMSLGTQIAKYLTRDKETKLENLEKAYHCLELEQAFTKEETENDPEWGFVSLDIYAKSDEEHLERYFSQFKDGDKLKSIMRKYVQADFSQAKGLLRKYINSKLKVYEGCKIKNIDGDTFSNYQKVVTVERIEGYKLWILETKRWVHIEDVEVV